ncbi:hypothetical protein QFZ49_003159 [Streptomyces turgidiscabies]|uniref:Uncharacterized protein n=1 Tax=Streptomyces turgidiscabies TaxID=85558 RepID=A0ABU0RMJ0_9ACTN|nr:hypothetical protein [Streptomyces turgidiscabies]
MRTGITIHWRYLYDPLGRRIAKQRLAANGVRVVEQTHFTWHHQDPRPIAPTERVGALKAPQDVIDSCFFAIVTDLVGTPTELLDESDTIVARLRGSRSAPRPSSPRSTRRSPT